MALNSKIFEEKTVLELASGTGIVGIVVCRCTGPKQVIMTDTLTEVVGIIKKNCHRNKVQNYSALKMDWNEQK